MSLNHKVARQIALQLQDAGYLAVLVGGCERDEAFNEIHGTTVEPKDFDVATNATPEQVAQVFGNQGKEPVGKTFGVMIVKREGINTEVATFREDGQYSDGRRPGSVGLVTTSNLEEALRIDGSRRDFTVNAMCRDPRTDRRYDLFGGMDDIRARVLRAVGDPGTRFVEDRLRMLRAVRFAAKYDMKLDETLRSALLAHATMLLPGDVTPWERVATELLKTLSSHHPGYGLTLLKELGLLELILPEMVPMWGPKGEQSSRWHPEGNAWVHTLMVCDAHAETGDETSEALGLALALHDIAKPDTQKFETVTVDGVETVHISNHGHAEVGAEKARVICNRLRLPSEVTNRVVTIVAEHMLMHDLGKPGVLDKTLFRLFRRPEAMDLIAMQHADSIGNGLPLDERLRNSHKAFFLGKMEQMKSLPAARRLDASGLVTSDHLFALGLKPGPIFSIVLDNAFDAQIEGTFSDADAGVAWVRDNLARLEAMVPPFVPRSKRQKRHCC
jgi:poly(A) polymerase